MALSFRILSTLLEDAVLSNLCLMLKEKQQF